MYAGNCGQFNDELVERYTFGRLTTTQAAAFEEHFLLCEACQERLEACDKFAVAAKLAGNQIVSGKAAVAAGAGSGVIRLAAAVVVVGRLASFLLWPHSHGV